MKRATSSRLKTPWRFVHTSRQSLIRHREVGQHTLKFHNALRKRLCAKTLT